jgi:hypothetical protein
MTRLLRELPVVSAAWWFFDDPIAWRNPDVKIITVAVSEIDDRDAHVVCARLAFRIAARANRLD